ncbi:MAG: PD-(D/E)XK nuclease family protein, partial [Sphingomonadales bacterium]|nr:PD-(D/E)XK nuclease family protein [Sphingomonadales bacterium]
PGGAAAPLPTWLTRAPAAEPRPARPLAPSSLGEDASADPPFPPGALIEAARRGTLVHRLLERLPAVAGDARADAARRWLARNAADLTEAARAEIAQSALAVVGDPRWADLFAADALAEVPVAALVGGRVVAGTIDRLVIRGDALRLVDFKTARRPPARLEDVPLATLRQMAAYAAALSAAYPGRRVEAALLYTQTPRLIEVPAEVLAAHKPDFAGDE